MARKETPKPVLALRRQIRDRVAKVQVELFPDSDGPMRMAASLGITPQQWYRYMDRKLGHLIPGPVILSLITTHHVRDQWLLRGTGEMFELDAADRSATLRLAEAAAQFLSLAQRRSA